MKLKLIFLILFLLLFNQNVFSKEKWSIDDDISKISFELPLLLGKNVKGEFKNFKGLVEIDYENKIENKGIFSVKINSIEMNYEKYKDILLSDIFFNQKKYPINIYGYSKELAEDHILNFFEDQKRYLIIRTSWVLSATGNNFLKKIIS